MRAQNIPGYEDGEIEDNATKFREKYIPKDCSPKSLSRNRGSSRSSEAAKEKEKRNKYRSRDDWREDQGLLIIKKKGINTYK